MWILREHKAIFLNLKFVQLIFTIVIIVIEIIQFAIYSNIKPDSPDVEAANLFIEHGIIKIWDYIVFSITLIVLGFYIYNFKRIWNKGPYIGFDFVLAAIWFTSAMANLDPAYKNHPIETCSSAQTSSLKTMCNTWIISVVFCWLNMLVFIISAYVSCRVRQEKRNGIYSKPSVNSETKNRTSQRQSALLKQGLENPDKSQPVMLESGIKPLMLVQLSKT